MSTECLWSARCRKSVLTEIADTAAFQRRDGVSSHEGCLSRRRTTASFFAAALFTGAKAEPFQYNDVITAPEEPKPPFHGLDRAAPRSSEVNVLGSGSYTIFVALLAVPVQYRPGNPHQHCQRSVDVVMAELPTDRRVIPLRRTDPAVDADVGPRPVRNQRDRDVSQLRRDLIRFSVDRYRPRFCHGQIKKAVISPPALWPSSSLRQQSVEIRWLKALALVNAQTFPMTARVIGCVAPYSMIGSRLRVLCASIHRPRPRVSVLWISM